MSSANPAINPDIKYSFKQIEYGLISFMSNLELKLQNILPNLPVFVLQTGDGSYYLDKKFTEADNKEIYQKVPRFIITVDDIQFLTEQNSNQYNKYIYQFEEENYMTVARRMAIMIPVNTDFVSSNFIRALENFEIMASITSRDNVFTYEFLGNTFEGAFILSSPSMEKPSMDVSSATRNTSIKNQLEVHLQLLVPRIESIKKLSDVGFESVQYNLTSRGNVDHNEKIIHNFKIIRDTENDRN